MKKIITTILFTFVLFAGAQSANAQFVFETAAPYTNSNTYYQQPDFLYPQTGNQDELYFQLLAIIQQLQQQLALQQQQEANFSNNNTFGQGGFNNGFTFTPTNGNSGNFPFNSNRDQRPRAQTDNARDIQDDSAELRGEIDMNDFRNGIVFFVYGQDEDMIEDVEDDYDEYDDVEDDEEDDDFEVVRVDNDLDDDEDYEEEVNNLEEDEDYYFIICVEYDDEDGDETLECGNVEDFETDDDNNSNSNDDKPDVETRSAIDIDDNSAELRGEVDMNDFDNGRVFFVWGEDEDQVEDAEDEDSFGDIDEDGDDLQTRVVDTDLDNSEDYELNVFALDNNTDIYFRICVQYDDEDNDDTLECGDVEDFETDN